MFSPPQVKQQHKIIIGVTVGLLLVGGIWALAFRYFEAYSDMSRVVTKNPVQQQAVNLVQLSENYGAESALIIDRFLVGVAAAGADIAGLAAQAQNELLALSLPAQYRSKHLSQVLILGEIQDAAAAGKNEAAAQKIAELERLSTNE